MMEAKPAKSSDLGLIYCEDPKNDPGGGSKARGRTINKTYRPDIDHFANGWHVVSDGDGQGTYRVQQKDLINCDPNAWMLVGENQGEDTWTSAKITVGGFLASNGAAPEIGEVVFFDMDPICPPDGDCLSHITDESGSAWALPNEELHIGTNVGGPFKPADLSFRWSTGTANAIAIISDNKTQDVRFKFKGTGGGFGSLVLSITDPYGGLVDKSLMVVGQNPDSMAVAA